MEEKTTDEKKIASEKVKTQKHKTGVTKRASTFFVVGVVLTLFNFGLYTTLARIVIKNNDFLWMAVLVSSVVTTILAYILHSRITWREQKKGRREVIGFLIWNGFEAMVINPVLTWFFGLLTGLYQFAFGISSFLGLPFDYNFVESTGAFGLMTVVIMVLNFFCYDKLIFKKK